MEFICQLFVILLGFLCNVDAENAAISFSDGKIFQSSGKYNVLDVAHKLGATTFLSLVIKTNLTAMFNETGKVI